MSAIRNSLIVSFIKRSQKLSENHLTRIRFVENGKTKQIAKYICKPMMSRSFYMFMFFILLLAINQSSVFAWTPPIGIPTPPWPANLDIARPTLPSPWTSDKTGYYFIQTSGCSDSRTYGNPTAPRCSIPTSPSAGSVIVINGTISGSKTISYNGTSSSPIWIMGYNPASKPTLTAYWDFTGSYLIADSLAWNYNARDGVGISGNHNMVRNCSMANPSDDSNGAGFATDGKYIVFYKNVVSQFGNWQYTGSTDIDRHGFKVVDNASDIWILDSQFYHCHGDGVQVGDENVLPSQINRVYIGRNIAYENYQSGFWTKNATDVIFSQNLVHDMHTATEFGVGQGIGGQYDPNYVWFINNIVRNSLVGIHIAGTSNGGGGPWYVIGNLIYNIKYSDNYCSNYESGAIGYRNDGGFTAIYNTVYNSDIFVAIPYGSGGELRIANNIFSIKDSSSHNCTAMSVDPTWIHDYNLVSDASWVAEAHEKSESAASSFIAPGSNFALNASSLAVGNGNPADEAAFAAFQSRYGIDIRKDILGTTRPQATKWDIGAYEYRAQSTTLPTPTISNIYELLMRDGDGTKN